MILIATSTEAGTAPQRFEAAGGDFTVGRGTDCGWTLPDPTRQLSKRHCRMAFGDGVWRVTDLSSNGMTLNDRPLTPGVSHPMQHGDRLGMGNYDIVLSLEAVRGNGRGQHPQPDAEASPFGDGRQGGRLVGDPFVSPGASDITDPFDVALPPFFEEPEQRPGPAASGGSIGDEVSSLRQPFEPPRPGHLLLPADWDEPLRPDGPAATPPGPPPIAQPFGDPFGAAEDDALPPHAAPMVEPSPVPSPPPAAAPAAAPSPASGHDEIADTAGIPRPAPAIPAPSREAVTTSASTQAPPPQQHDEASLRAFAAFARGAGLDGVPQGAPEEALEKLGRAFRAYVVGLRRLLIARATVKGEFRIDRTMIRPFGNNPIKFATDDDDALAALLGIGRQVGMSAEQAVSDSIRDVRTHELALTEAFQHGIRQLVMEMSPEQVSADLQPGAFDMVPVLRNSRLWKTYEARHAKMQASLDNSFDSVFGQAFARGYEAALSALSDTEPDDAPVHAGRKA